jgi:hypothetical protein
MTVFSHTASSLVRLVHSTGLSRGDDPQWYAQPGCSPHMFCHRTVIAAPTVPTWSRRASSTGARIIDNNGFENIQVDSVGEETCER